MRGRRFKMRGKEGGVVLNRERKNWERQGADV